MSIYYCNFETATATKTTTTMLLDRDLYIYVRLRNCLELIFWHAEDVSVTLLQILYKLSIC